MVFALSGRIGARVPDCFTVESEFLAGQLEAGENPIKTSGPFGRDGEDHCEGRRSELDAGFVAGKVNDNAEVLRHQGLFVRVGFKVRVDNPDKIIEPRLAVAVGRAARTHHAEGDVDFHCSGSGLLVDIAQAGQFDADDFPLEIDVDQVAAGAVLELDHARRIGDDPVVGAFKHDRVLKFIGEVLKSRTCAQPKRQRAQRHGPPPPPEAA